MTVLLYDRGRKLMERSGIGRAMLHQAKALEENRIHYTKDGKEAYDIIQLNTVLPDSVLRAAAARLAGKSVVYYAHSTREDFCNSFKGSNLLAPLFGAWIRFCYNRGDIVITPTPYSKGLLGRAGVRPPVMALSNGVDLDFFSREKGSRRAFREKYGLREETKAVISVGHYIERKGILEFAQLAEEYPDVQFLWFGYTPSNLLTARVKRLLREHPANLRFAGYVPMEELRDAYAGADAFLFMTHEETEGIVLLEAMAMKIPVLIRDIPIYEGWLADGQNVYKASSQEEFSSRLKGMLEGRLADLTEAGYQVAASRNLKAVGEELAAVYAHLLREKLRRGRNLYENFDHNRLVCACHKWSRDFRAKSEARFGKERA